MFYRRGDKVTAQRKLVDINVAAVPAGSEGRVISTTLLGAPSKVEFELDTLMGTRKFKLPVQRGDVR